MFGLGFLNSLFLFGLMAMSIPIVIHLLNRRRLRRVRFSSLEFIVDLNRRRMSKINLRRWIILLLRTLAVVLIVLGFARPTLKSDAALFVPGKAPKHVVICVDASYSMRVEKEKGTAFSEAKAIAKRIVDEAGSNDLFNVIAFSSHDEIVFEAGTRNRQVVKSAIEALEVTAESASVVKALETAVGLIEQSSVTTGEIYIVSDFREDTDSLEVFTPPERIRVIHLPVYREAVDNVSIDRVQTPRKLVRPSEIVRVGVVVTNHSRENSANFPLELLIDGKRRAEKVVELSPSSSSTVSFAVSVNDWGTYRCKVAKNRDRLPIDDERFFLMEISAKVPVTVVRGRKFTSEGNQVASFFYIEKALNPRGSGDGEFSVETVDEDELTMSKLHGKSVVVWADPGNISASRLDLLKRYVAAGGSMMIFLGDAEKGLTENKAFADYIGARRAAVKEKTDGARFVSFEKGHPVFSIFSEEELELLSESRVRRYVSVGGVSPDSVLAYLGNADPGIWECRRGRGRLLIVAASPDMPSGNLPLSPMFLPFIHTGVSYLAGTAGADPQHQNLAGVDLYFDLPPDGRHSSSRLRVENQIGIVGTPSFFDSPTGETKVMLTRPSQVGFYRLLADTSVVAQTVVNVDTRESNLNPRVLDPARLEASIVEASVDFSRDLARQKEGREIYAVFLVLALAALVLEAILGRRA